MTGAGDIPVQDICDDGDEVPCFKCGQYQLSSIPSSLAIYSLLVCLLPFLLILPNIMLYIGITYSYCQDMFSTWLIVGGTLFYLDSLFFLSWMFLRRKKKVSSSKQLIASSE